MFNFKYMRMHFSSTNFLILNFCITKKFHFSHYGFIILDESHKLKKRNNCTSNTVF